MILTAYGKRGNKWTEKVTQALLDVYDFKLVEEFNWARDRFGRDEACRVDECGVAWVTRMPTLRVIRWRRSYPANFDSDVVHFITQPSDEWWVIGVQDCLSFIERYRDEMLKLRGERSRKGMGWSSCLPELQETSRLAHAEK